MQLISEKKPVILKHLISILAGIYIIGMFIGIFAIGFVQGRINERKLIANIDEFAQKYSENGSYGTIQYAYGFVVSENGLVIGRFDRINRGLLIKDPAHMARERLDKVMQGKSFMDMIWFEKNRSKLGYTSFLLLAAPYVRDGRVAGGYFLVKEIPDLLVTELAFIIMFSFSMIIVSGVLIWNQKRIHEYESNQKKYIDNLTHELKTPVSSIIALTEALSDQKDLSGTEKNEYYGMIIREARGQKQMIQDALDLSKIQAGYVDSSLSKVASSEIFSRIKEKYAPMCDLLEIGFKIDKSCYDLGTVYTNREGVIQVIDIAVNNSLKYIGENGNITISVRKGRKEATICIEDDGCGIEKEDLPHIFDRFYKGSRQGHYGGSGLGLAIAWEIINSIHEKIWIKSEIGKGTKVFFTVSL